MKRFLTILSSILIVLFFTSCENIFGDLFSSNKNNVTIYVYDVDSWTPENIFFGDDVSGANVKLLDKNNPNKSYPLYEGISEWDGNIESDSKVTFEKIPKGEYILHVVKGEKFNILEKEIVDNVEIGFIITGVFQTQVEVEMSDQPNAYVGGPIIMDFNGDGKYDISDKRAGRLIEVDDDVTLNALIAEDQ